MMVNVLLAMLITQPAVPSNYTEGTIGSHSGLAAYAHLIESLCVNGCSPTSG